MFKAHLHSKSKEKAKQNHFWVSKVKLEKIDQKIGARRIHWAQHIGPHNLV